MAHGWEDNPRLSELLELVRGAAEARVADAERGRGYIVALAQGDSLLGSQWVAGSSLAGPGGRGGPATPGGSPLGAALELAVANYARGRVFVTLLWSADTGSAQIVIAPVPHGHEREPAVGAPDSYCSQCGAIADDARAPCQTCGGRYHLRLVPDLPIAA